ncbi:hypothetical protein MKW92_025212 [Papaver armeniacum]|nr:hypothetical protein MKW92_025212 [Papaver armeniacum]
MAATLLPWTNIPSYVFGASHASNRRGLAVANRSTVKIIRNNHVRMRGLRASTPSFPTKTKNSINETLSNCLATHKLLQFERYTDKAITVIMLAQDEVRRLGHNHLGTEKILLGLIAESTGIAAKVLRSMGIKLTDARTEVEKLIGRGPGGNFYIFTHAKRVLEHLSVEAQQLEHNYIGTEHLLLGLLHVGDGGAARVLENLRVDADNICKQVFRMVEESRTPTLEEYGTNLTKLAEEGKLDPVIGRAAQIERVTEILSRRMKNNPCLIGEPGVGKTAIAEGLAQRISSGDVPKTIQGKKVITLSMGLLIAGIKFTKLVKKTKTKISWVKRTVRFRYYEIHTLNSAAANILKPALARGELQCIGATTLDEYRKHFEKDPALERRFQPVKVPEPTVDESIQILKGLRERYETHHNVRYTDESLEAAARLSYQYINDRFLPEKAIDLIDQAGSRVQLGNAQLTDEARELEKELRQIIKERNEAFRGKHYGNAGELRDRENDLKWKEGGSAGPIVVTEVDIQHIVASWTGIPVDKVSIDESARLLKMTSNVGSSVIEKGDRRKGFFDLDYDDEKDSSYDRIKSLVQDELKHFFKPEFLNRLDEMIVFRQLTKLEVKEIADMMLKEVFERLRRKDIEVRVTDNYGARPLRRAVTKLLEDNLAEKILGGDIKEGDSVIIDVDGDGSVTVVNDKTSTLVQEFTCSTCPDFVSEFAITAT